MYKEKDYRRKSIISFHISRTDPVVLLTFSLGYHGLHIYIAILQ
jgi:hypothetical protein